MSEENQRAEPPAVPEDASQVKDEDLSSVSGGSTDLRQSGPRGGTFAETGRSGTARARLGYVLEEIEL